MLSVRASWVRWALRRVVVVLRHCLFETVLIRRQIPRWPVVVAMGVDL